MYHSPRSLAHAYQSDGGVFDYACSPSLFLGRAGLGPLRVWWDTSVLIDWGEFGHDILDGKELQVAHLPEEYAEDVEALAVLMDPLWMTRDLRIRVSDRQLSDAKKPLGGERQELRERQIREIIAALECIALDLDNPESNAADTACDADLSFIRDTVDRTLVRDAIEAGCHVFLTRDKKHILRHANRLHELGLVVLSPMDLRVELAHSSELGETFGVDGLVCDNHKWGHLWSAFETQSAGETRARASARE